MKPHKKRNGARRAGTPEYSQKKDTQMKQNGPLTPPTSSSSRGSGKLSPDKLSALRDKIAEQRRILEEKKQKQLLEDFLNGDLEPAEQDDDDGATWG